MTVREILARVRLSVNDTETANPRWTDTDLVGYLNSGIREFVRLRPDLKLDDEGKVGLVHGVTAVGDTVGIPREYLTPLANYVAEQVFSEDGADTGNIERAKWHRNAWREAVTGA